MQGSKRPRSGTSESFGQAGMVLNPSMAEYGTLDANMSMNGATSEQIGSRWGWDDDDDRGMGMDIQALLSEFGDFGDFFENDALPFGEVIYIFYALFWIIYLTYLDGRGMLIFRARQLTRPSILIILGFSSLSLNRIVPDSLLLVSKVLDKMIFPCLCLYDKNGLSQPFLMKKWSCLVYDKNWLS